MLPEQPRAPRAWKKATEHASGAKKSLWRQVHVIAMVLA